VIDNTTDFITFSTAWEPADSDKVLFAAWASSKAPRYAYVGWDDNIAAAQSNDTTSFFALCDAAGYKSVVPIYDPVNPMSVAAFFMGTVASVDTSRTNVVGQRWPSGRAAWWGLAWSARPLLTICKPMATTLSADMPRPTRTISPIRA
jgi:hypothetical protein